MPQSPTCAGIKIRSVHDAQLILYACHIGRLEMIKMRLDSADRHALASGNVYAWEERSPRSDPMGSGIERFTEGKRWTASRLRDDFLFYYEKYLHLSEHDQKIVPPKDWDPFVKQTYSAWVNTENGNRKWHLTAYYTQRTEDRLGTIDDIPALRDIVVPPGYFLSNADIRSNKPVDTEPYNTQRTFSPMYQVPRPPHQTPSPDSHHHKPSPYPATPSVSHAPTSRYDHHGDTFAIPPRYAGGKNDGAYPAFHEDISSRPGYVSRFTDGPINLPPVTHSTGPPIIAIAKTRPTRPSSYHDSYSTGHRAIPRPNTDEPPLSLVPMNNLIAHHPFPRDVQDEQVLRVFMPRLE